MDFAGGGMLVHTRWSVLLGPRFWGRGICLLLFAFASCDACNSAIEVGLGAAPNGLLEPYEDFGLTVLVPDLRLAGGLMPEFRLPVYDEFDVFLEDIEPDCDMVEAFEELRYKDALEAFWLAALGGRETFEAGCMVSPARSMRVFRFWAGSGTESRKPSTCMDSERNPQFDP